MGCLDVLTKDASGSGFHGANNLESREHPYGFSCHGDFVRNRSLFKILCSLTAQKEVPTALHSEIRNWKYSVVAVQNGVPNLIHVSQVNANPNLLHADNLTKNIHYHLSATSTHCERTSLEIMSLGIGANGQLLDPNLVAEKTSSTGALSASEEPPLHRKIDDDFSCLHTLAMSTSMDGVICTLKKCRQMKDPTLAMRAYFHICFLGHDTLTELGNHLVPMLAICGCLPEGQKVFNRLMEPNEHCWTSLIQGSIECRNWQNAMELFKIMEHSSVFPSSFTYVALLKGCAIERLTESGRGLHAEVTKQGHDTDSFVGNILVDMYSKCGSLEEAQKVFDELPVHDVVSWNSLIAGYIDHGQSEEALSCYDTIQEKGLPCDDLTLVFALKASSNIGALDRGQEIHAEIARDSYECYPNLGSTLVDMYAKCGSLLEAREVFDNVRDRDAISWNPLMTAYVEYGLGVEALECLEDMKLEGFSPDAVALAGCLKACGSVGASRKGHEIHGDCTKQGIERDPLVGCAVVDMYGKFGDIGEAQEVFNTLPVQDVVPWTALISSYADCGFGEEALNCLEQMRVEGVLANDVTRVCCLKACGSIEAGGKGRHLHLEIAKEGLEKDPFIGSALVDMYAKCGALPEASESLRKLPVKGVVVWTALIAGYVEVGLNEEAFDCLKQMQFEGVLPNAVTVVCGLKACGNLELLSSGLELHAHIVIEGFELEPLVGTSLVDMYVRCGSVLEACEVFEKLSVRDVAAWNAMIAGYVEHDLFEEALSYFRGMHFEGLSPNAVTYVLLLKACGMLKAIGRGQEIFIQTVKQGLEEDTYIGNALIDFFAKCDCLVDAREEFEKLPVRDVVSWTSLIAGYADHGFFEEALDCASMMKLEGLSSDGGTFVCCLKACSNMKAIDRGYETHMELVMEGFEKDTLVGNTLVDMYAKCGCIMDAQDAFDELQNQDVVAWTALIGGYALNIDESKAFEHFQRMKLVGVCPDVMTWNNIILGYAEKGDCLKASFFYRQMQEQGLLPNMVSFTHSLKACGSTAALEVGRRVAAHIYGLAQVKIVMENAIIDMYGRCGSMAEAQRTFEAMSARQLVTWNGLIMGFARQGGSDAIFSLVSRMRDEGFQPNEVTLLCVLSTCSHAGLVDKGKEFFNAVETECSLEENIIHHNCVIDMLSRAGRFDEVSMWLQEMHIQPNLDSWITVLSACQIWGNVELGKYAFERLVKLDKSNKAAFVIMGNIYANANMWDEVRRIEAMKMGLKSCQITRICRCS